MKTNNNAAIISLLNSAPAAMTSSTVVNNINNTPSTSPMTLSVQSNSSNQVMDGPLQQAATLLPKTSHMGQTTRKISLQSTNQLQGTVAGSQNRLLNQTNLIAVNANSVLGTAAQMVGIQSPATQHCAQTLLSPDAQGNQQLSVRVTMSALASQLASPPAMMSSAINPQNYNFAQLKQTTQTQQQSQQQQQQIILSGNVGTTSNRYTSVRRDAMAAPSPGSDSNASNASSSNLGCNNSFTINPGFPFLGPATSPTTSVISNDGSTCQSATGLADRLNTNSNSISHHSPLSTGGGPSPLSNASSTHFMAPSPKSNLSQHIQVQSPASISPLSSPPHQVIQTQQPQSQSTNSFAVTTANVDRGLARGLSNSQGHSQTHDGNAQQQQTQQSHIQPQTTTLNLQGINLQSLQGAMATFPGLQNVQVRFPRHFGIIHAF